MKYTLIAMMILTSASAFAKEERRGRRGERRMKVLAEMANADGKVTPEEQAILDRVKERIAKRMEWRKNRE